MATLKEELESLYKEIQDQKLAREERRMAALDAVAQKRFNKLIGQVPDTLRKAVSRDQKGCEVFDSFSINVETTVEFTKRMIAEEREKPLVNTETDRFSFSTEEILYAIAGKVAEWCKTQGFTSEVKDGYTLGCSVKKIWITFIE